MVTLTPLGASGFCLLPMRPRRGSFRAGREAGNKLVERVGKCGCRGGLEVASVAGPTDPVTATIVLA